MERRVLETNTECKLFYLPANVPKPSSPQLVSSDDLEQFRIKLLMDIKKMLDGHLNKTSKRWLKSNEVKKLPGISAGTLQALRNNRKIPFTRIGRLIFYDAAEIDNILAIQEKKP